MVIHEENEEPPVEISLIKQPLYQNSKYIFIANPKAEMAVTCQGCTFLRDEEERQKFYDELKDLYYKCKSVMKTIETKYGPLLIRDDRHTKRRRVLPDDDDEEECRCAVNQKIIYDNDGNAETVDVPLENHVCSKKPKMSFISERYGEHEQVQVDYNDVELQLPDNLSELTKILMDPDLSVENRYKVLDKIKVIRHDYANDIKFNKRALIEKLKTNPDEVFRFKGTNFSSLPGYF